MIGPALVREIDRPASNSRLARDDEGACASDSISSASRSAGKPSRPPGGAARRRARARGGRADLAKLAARDREPTEPHPRGAGVHHDHAQNLGGRAERGARRGTRGGGGARGADGAPRPRDHVRCTPFTVHRSATELRGTLFTPAGARSGRRRRLSGCSRRESGRAPRSGRAHRAPPPPRWSGRRSPGRRCSWRSRRSAPRRAARSAGRRRSPG